MVVVDLQELARMHSGLRLPLEAGFRLGGWLAEDSLRGEGGGARGGGQGEGEEGGRLCGGCVGCV